MRFTSGLKFVALGGVAGLIMAGAGLLPRVWDTMPDSLARPIESWVCALSGIPMALAATRYGQTDAYPFWTALAIIASCVLWGSVGVLMLGLFCSVIHMDVQRHGVRRAGAILLMAGIGIVFVINVMIGAFWWGAEVGDRPGLYEIADIAHLDDSFPRGTRVVHSRYYSGWQVGMLYARMDMDRARIPEFIASLPGKTETSSTDDFGMRGNYWDDSPSWWYPMAITEFTAISVSYPDGFSDLCFLIDKTGSRKATMYVQYSR